VFIALGAKDFYLTPHTCTDKDGGTTCNAFNANKDTCIFVTNADGSFPPSEARRKDVAGNNCIFTLGTTITSTDLSTFDCTADSTQTNIFDTIVSDTGCCGIGDRGVKQRSKCWINGTNGICESGNIFDHKRIAQTTDGPMKGNTVSCDNVVVGAPALDGFKVNPVTFDCKSSRVKALALNNKVNQHECCTKASGGPGHSKCHKDWSFICKDPTKYAGNVVPAEIVGQGANTKKLSCDDLAYFLYAESETNVIYPDLGLSSTALVEYCQEMGTRGKRKHDIEANLLDSLITDGGCCGGGHSICQKIEESEKTVQVEFAVNHTVVLQGMTATEFKNDPAIIKSFRESVATLLGVETTDVINIVATSTRRLFIVHWINRLLASSSVR
jgi:hypothetical protein